MVHFPVRYVKSDPGIMVGSSKKSVPGQHGHLLVLVVPIGKGLRDPSSLFHIGDRQIGLQPGDAQE